MGKLTNRLFEEKRVKTTWKTNAAIFWKGWVCSFLIALIVATSFKSAIADWNIVPTGSMKPTILEGDRIFVNKLAYDLKIPYTTVHIAAWADPRRGDIVVFFSPVDGTRLVKRVVGIPGDSLKMVNNRLIINGEEVAYQLLNYPETHEVFQGIDANQHGYLEDLGDSQHPVVITPRRQSLRSFATVTIPEGKYFMMGDNRDNSADSRYFGLVDRSLVVGRATSVVISLDSNDRYQPRWERFFTGLL